jgi:hypothetical protein
MRFFIEFMVDECIDQVLQPLKFNQESFVFGFF